jgi:SAM-dependent methyltransferase
MDHADHVALLRAGVATWGGVWADLGAGRGAFTLALADLLGPGSTVHAVDLDAAALRDNAATFGRRFPGVSIQTHATDFTRALPFAIASLDGVVMANSLHFLRDGAKEPVLRSVIAAIRPGGRFILVEYGADRGNPWVPHPLSFETWTRLAADVGLVGTHEIGRVPSRFLGSIYAAASDVPEGGAASGETDGGAVPADRQAGSP